MVAGLAFWHFGDTSLYRVNPPLIKVIATLPVFLSKHETNWAAYIPNPQARSEFVLGSAFFKLNGVHSFWLFSIARWICIPLSIMGGIVCYCWATDLYGSKSGILALTMWCFSPNVLTWGASITPDLGTTALGIIASYAMWKWLKTPEWFHAIFSGVFLGLALLSKTLWIFLFIYWPLYWFFLKITSKNVTKSQWINQGVQLSIILMIGIYFVNLGYGFRGTFKPLGQYHFISNTLTGNTNHLENTHGLENRFRGGILEKVLIPVPEDYVLGIDLQKRDFELGKWSYLRGEHRLGGWWYYYIYAILIKVPLGYWLLFLLACFYTLKKLTEVSYRDDLFLILPAVIILVLISSQTGFTKYLRYALPCFPFVFIWMSKIAQLCGQQFQYSLTIYISMTWAIVSSLTVYPHSMSYFNELIGGPSAGAKHLLDANIDWGQDLLELKKWCDQQPAMEPFYADCFTFLNMNDLGIQAKHPPSEASPGWYAISITQRYGRGKRYKYLDQFEPVKKIGYSILIYHLTDSANK
ncbi:ArnT family glycosyltransferase [Gimesia fumaroli]|nr:glycosyltransferase family 39 protein [Gimesia fumaroli]